MSVQAGIWNFDGRPINREELRRISLATAEYGPDGEAFHIAGNVCLLYRLFKTTTASGHNQPYLLADGRVITFDGRLDNRDELISRLEQMLKDDRTDVAIVAAALDYWGSECFAYLVGDWALSIWNPQERELILARDYLGVKPLFYYPRAATISWCTHLAPLVLCGEQFTLSHDYVAGYLALHPDAHLTPYEEIHSVPPGKFVRLRRATRLFHTHWAFNPGFVTRYRTDTEYEEHFRYLFRRAVRRRLSADNTPVLAELSGGWDSSAIVCMGDDILSKGGAETSRLDTFSYYDSKEPSEDDLYHFTKVEERRGRTGFHIDLAGSGNSLSLEYKTFSPIPGFEIRAEVKTGLSEILVSREYRVMLCGNGGDEVNGQPLDPRVVMADHLAHLRFAMVASQLVKWSLLMRVPVVHLCFQTLLQFLPLRIRALFTAQGKVEPWLNSEFARKYRLSARQLEDIEGFWLLRPGARDAAQTVATLARRMSYGSPPLVDRRYPYLDRELLEFLTSIPLSQLLRPGQRRFLMRRALADLLPEEIRQRQTKTSAGRCYAISLGEHWERVESLFRSPLVAQLGYVDRDGVSAAFRAVKTGRIPITILQLLKALSLELWLRDAQARGIISIQASSQAVANRFRASTDLQSVVGSGRSG